jgi:hypothetical protein
MKRVLNRLVLVKVYRLQASILIADVKGSVNWVKRKRDGVSRQEEIPQDMTGLIVPSNGSIILSCRDHDIVSTGAVSHCDCGNGGAVVRECAERRVRGLPFAAGWRFCERKKIYQGPYVDGGIRGAGKNKIGGGINRDSCDGS